MTEWKQWQLTRTELAREIESLEVEAAHVNPANMNAKACVLLPAADRTCGSGGIGE
jgi:hypothetical protein